MVVKAIILLTLLGLVAGQPPRPNGADGEFFAPSEGGRPPIMPRSVGPAPLSCRRVRIREVDGRCTSRRNENFARAGQVHFSYFDVDSTNFLDKGLKSPRVISNLVAAQDGDIFNDRDLNELTTFFGQFLDHNVASTPLGDEEMDIEPDVGDSEAFPFRRSSRLELDDGEGERPFNVLPTAIDLAAVYGNSEERNLALRVEDSCLLKTSSGDLLPFNTVGLSNAPTSGREFYVAGDTRSNEHPALTVLHTIWLREHNRLCEELGPKLPSLSGSALYEEVRAVNIAQFQKVVYEEYFPALTGRSLGPFRGFRGRANPTLSSLFSTAAFRVGHTMVGNVISEIDEAGNVEGKELRSSFFVPDSVAGGIDSFVRGLTMVKAQEIDVKVVNGLRNFLFEDVPEEEGPDLISLNLQRGRDHNIPSFNDVRQEFGVRRARTFSDITTDADVRARLEAAYDSVDDVEAWVGLMAEDHMPNSSFGTTLFRVWEREFERLRDGDQFFFLGNRAFSRLLRRELPEVVERIQDPSVRIFRDIILENTNLIPPAVNEDVFKSAA